MMGSNPLEPNPNRPPANRLYQSTKPKQEPEEMPTTAPTQSVPPTPRMSPEPVADVPSQQQPPHITTTPPMMIEGQMPEDQFPRFNGAPISPIYKLGQPLAHDRRSKISAKRRFEDKTFQLDIRLIPYFYDCVSKGMSIRAVFNELLLEALINRGYDIDPHLIDKPATALDVFNYEQSPYSDRD
jgi:hypothetical protein